MSYRDLILCIVFYSSLSLSQAQGNLLNCALRGQTCSCTASALDAVDNILGGVLPTIPVSFAPTVGCASSVVTAACPNTLTGCLRTLLSCTTGLSAGAVAGGCGCLTAYANCVSSGIGNSCNVSGLCEVIPLVDVAARISDTCSTAEDVLRQLCGSSSGIGSTDDDGSSDDSEISTILIAVAAGLGGIVLCVIATCCCLLLACFGGLKKLCGGDDDDDDGKDFDLADILDFLGEGGFRSPNPTDRGIVVPNGMAAPPIPYSDPVV
eukprot:NODE_1188_length_961_cov_90.046763_g1143_i0.p1 GENE.NODE_1188_length_961_cov_90.046763_g1143_i0~~NODE_1188_length_961_cov_90.046763_g1143_i0.p1  ORF type:complete len:265 (-),score=36.23 NODE_1188_length_961_cov_90.046763_g1143_i0:56-850(-)